jgi:hypothetical protein
MTPLQLLYFITTTKFFNQAFPNDVVTATSSASWPTAIVPECSCTGRMYRQMLKVATNITQSQIVCTRAQAVKTVAGNLRVSAVDAGDGTIEALDHPGKRFMLAVHGT